MRAQHIEKRGKYNLVYFTTVQQELNKEVIQHPELMERLKNHPAGEFEIRLAEIAAYCNLALDDTYQGKDIDNICEYCLNYLQRKRIPIILP